MAAELLGWKSIRAEVASLSDEQMVKQSLIENIERQDLDDYEKGHALKKTSRPI